MCRPGRRRASRVWTLAASCGFAPDGRRAMNALQLWTKASKTRLGQWWQLKSAPGRRRMDLALYRMSGGRLTLLSGLLPCLMLTTTGRRSGRQYTTPVVYAREAGEVIVVASKDGTPGDPQWVVQSAGEAGGGVVDPGRARFVRGANPGSERCGVGGAVVAGVGAKSDLRRSTVGARAIPFRWWRSGRSRRHGWAERSRRGKVDAAGRGVERRCPPGKLGRF